MKIAVLLFAVMTCSILIRLLEDKSVADMNESFVSMYNDRLIPATDLFYVAEYIQEKRVFIEEAIYSDPSDVISGNLHIQISRYDASIDSLIAKYQKTFLVKQEKDQLIELKKRLYQSAQLESKALGLIMNHNKMGARDLYEQAGKKASKKAIEQLSALMGTQRTVGQELLKDSEFMVSGSKLYSTLQVTLAIFIGILIVGIVFTSNLVKINNEKFHLN